MPGFMFVIIIGAIVGFVARILYPGPNTVHGFILTTFLGIIGAALATFLEQYFGLLPMRHLADPFSMVIGAMIILFAWNRLAHHRVVYDPGMHAKPGGPASTDDT